MLGRGEKAGIMKKENVVLYMLMRQIIHVMPPLHLKAHKQRNKKTGVQTTTYLLHVQMGVLVTLHCPLYDHRS